MAHSQLIQYRIFQKILKVLRLSVGIYPLEKPGMFYRTFPYMHLILMLFKLLGIVGSLVANRTSMMRFTFCLIHVLSQITSTQKLIILLVYHNDLRDLSKTLDGYFETLIKNSRMRDVVFEGFNKIFYLMMSVWIMFFLTCLFAVIQPTMAIFTQLRHHLYPVKYNFQAHSVYPWPMKPGERIWWLHYWSECVAVFSLFAASSSSDSLFVINLFLIMAQLREISYSIFHLDKEKDSDSVVRDCLHRHKLLMQCRNKIEKIFGPQILWTVITQAIALCVTTFQLLQPSRTGLEVAFLLAYVILKLLQIFLVGYVASELTTESENYRNAAYGSNWYGNKRLMSSIIITLNQKPMIIMAFGCIVISIDIFRSTVNTMMSYYFMLKTLQQ